VKTRLHVRSEIAEYSPNFLVLFGVVWCSLAQFGPKKLLFVFSGSGARVRAKAVLNTRQSLMAAPKLNVKMLQ